MLLSNLFINPFYPFGCTVADGKMATSQKLWINLTKQVWREVTDIPVTEEDAREASENAAGFYQTLLQWAEQAEPKKRASNGQ